MSRRSIEAFSEDKASKSLQDKYFYWKNMIYITLGPVSMYARTSHTLKKWKDVGTCRALGRQRRSARRVRRGRGLNLRYTMAATVAAAAADAAAPQQIKVARAWTKSMQV